MSMVKNKICIDIMKYRRVSCPGEKKGITSLMLYRFLSDPIDQMHYRHGRMPKKHFWTGIPHYFSDPYPHLRFITMHRTFGTGGFTLLKRTQLKAFQCVSLDCRAIIAQTVTGMMIPAIHIDHRLYRLLFPLHP